jgi:hypothetical protein
MATSDPTVRALAQCVYELDRVKKGATGPHWEDVPALMQDELVGLVVGVLAGIPVEQQHEAWFADQLLAGWKFGPDYDPVLKTDPRLVHWDAYTDQQKSDAQKAVATIRALTVLAN